MKIFSYIPAQWVLLLVLFLMSCGKKEIPTPDFDVNRRAPLSIEFDAIVGDRTLVFNQPANPYQTASGEEFSLSKLQFFISNVSLETTDGHRYVVPQDSSYFLVNGADRSSRFARMNVPLGEYRTLTFLLGVDSLRSTMPIEQRTGVLDPALGGGDHSSGMYWGWNSGYIFFKMEGNAPSISDDSQGDPTGKKQFRYHIGGFGGYSSATINNLKTIRIDLTKGGLAYVRPGRSSNIHLFVDVAQVFDGKKPFSIAQHPSVMFSAFSTTVADNFERMFRHDHTEN